MRWYVPTQLVLLACAACSTTPTIDVRAADAVDIALVDTLPQPDVAPPPRDFRGRPLTSRDHGLREADAIAYDLNLAVSDATPGGERFEAVATLFLLALEDLSSVSVDFEANEVDSVQALGVAATFARTANSLNVQLPARVSARTPFVVRVAYHGPFRQVVATSGFNTNGGALVRQRTRDGRRMFLTLNWPNRARRWLPCRDHPRDGAMIAMRLTFPDSFTVVANGRRTAESGDGRGNTVWTFEALTPMPTYDFHFAGYEGWTIVETPPTSRAMRVEHWDYPADIAAGATIYRDIHQAVDYFESSFGVYRWDALRFLEEPQIGGGMEHSTAVSMDESIYTGSSGRLTAIHELAHHWSGNLTRIHTWNDFWLSEGFTDYLTRRYVEHADDATTVANLWRQTLAQALGAETRMPAPHALRPPGDDIDVLTIFDQISYKKGAFVLRMLEREVGVDRLSEFLRRWFDTHEFVSATTADFQRDLETFVGRSLATFFAQWIYRAGFPALEVTYSHEAATSMTSVTVIQVPRGSGGAYFEHPLDLEFSDGVATQRVTMQVSGATSRAAFMLPFVPNSVTPDPAQTLYGVFTCPTRTCRAGYLCRVLGADPVQVCIPSQS